jgi:MOSC domain-containing protein YiiM
VIVSEGKLLEIHIASEKGGPMRSVDEVRAVPGRGLEGDRTYLRAEARGRDAEPHREVTLIESETLQALPRDSGFELTAADTRRNLLTSHVPLNHLVDREFRIGEVVLRGVQLCEPCATLEKRTTKGAREALLHRAGLRARILRGGVLRVGDPISGY